MLGGPQSVDLKVGILLIEGDASITDGGHGPEGPTGWSLKVGWENGFGVGF